MNPYRSGDWVTRLTTSLFALGGILLALTFVLNACSPGYTPPTRDPDWTPRPTPTCSEAIASLNVTLDALEYNVADGIATQEEADRVEFYRSTAEAQMANLQRRGCLD